MIKSRVSQRNHQIFRIALRYEFNKSQSEFRFIEESRMQIVIAFSCLIRINRDYDRLEQVKSMANILERISWIIKSAIFLASKIPYI